jgi:hypothetical protein
MNIKDADLIQLWRKSDGTFWYINGFGTWTQFVVGGDGDCCTDGTPFVGFEPDDAMPNGGTGKVNFGITTSGNLQTKNAAGVQQFFAPTGNVKRYKAIVSQTPVYETSGLLVVGEEYVVDTLEAGDDFLNVGYISVGVTFTATGTTPTNWSNGSSVLFLNQSQPIIENEIFNDIPTLTVTYGDDGLGSYKTLFRTSGLFLASKTFFVPLNLQRVSNDLLTYPSGTYESIEFEIYP